MFETLLVSYARHFPVERGKYHLVNSLWPRVAGRDSERMASLLYGGFRMRCDLREMLQRQFYFFGTYYLERDLLECWSALARTAQIVFDVGANAGIYSLAALAAQPNAKVHAFEPTPEIAAHLRETARLNGLETLLVHELAISDHTGQANLVRFSGEDGTNGGMNYIASGRSGETVTTVTLDAFCEEAGIGRIALMKMDIQGAEAAALRGATGLLAAGAIGVLFLELNWSDDTASCPATEAVALLDANGYSFSAPSREPLWRKAGPWLHGFSDIVASRVVEDRRS